MVVVRPDGKRANDVAVRWLQEVAVPFTGDDCLPWPFQRNHLGRPVFKMDYRTQYACRVVCERAHGPPPTPEHVAAHSCGQGHEGCINPSHLRWATHKENSLEMVEHGRSTRGSANPRSKLRESDAHEVKRLLRAGERRQAIADRFGVTKSAIDRIAQGRNWGWL